MRSGLVRLAISFTQSFRLGVGNGILTGRGQLARPWRDDSSGFLSVTSKKKGKAASSPLCRYKIVHENPAATRRPDVLTTDRGEISASEIAASQRIRYGATFRRIGKTATRMEIASLNAPFSRQTKGHARLSRPGMRLARSTGPQRSASVCMRVAYCESVPAAGSSPSVRSCMRVPSSAMWAAILLVQPGSGVGRHARLSEHAEPRLHFQIRAGRFPRAWAAQAEARSAGRSRCRAP